MADVITTAAGQFVPDIISRETVKGFTGKAVLQGSGAVVVMPGLKTGANGVGGTVKVPYVANIGEFKTYADGDPIETDQLTSAAETGTIARFGKGVQITRQGFGAQVSGGRTPDQIAADMLRVGALRAFDSALITAAARNTANEWDAYTNDISGGSGAAAYFSLDAVVDTIGKLGDEGLSPDEYALAMLHSKTVLALMKLKDSTGRPLLFQDASNGTVSYKLFGIPVKVTDKAPVAAGVYQSIFLKRNALALWFDESAGIDIVREGKTDSWRMDCNVYAVVHRYKHLDGGVAPGVAILKHKLAA